MDNRKRIGLAGTRCDLTGQWYLSNLYWRISPGLAIGAASRPGGGQGNEGNSSTAARGT